MYGTLNSIEEICVWLQHLREAAEISLLCTFIHLYLDISRP